MATLYVENVPDELYKALRKRAKERGNSISTEVISLLSEEVPTEEELKARRRYFEQMERLRSTKLQGPGPFPSFEEMIREDRER
jgi:plasmid stability protein